MSKNDNIIIILLPEPVKKAQPLPVPREPQPGPSTAPDTPVGIKPVSSVVLVCYKKSFWFVSKYEHFL